MTTYLGDERLGALLAQAGISTPLPALRDLLRGVVAAPTPPDALARDWMTLATGGATLDAALADQLDALRDVVAGAEAERIAMDPPLRQRVAALRATFAAHGVAGFLIPRADEHQGEYVPKRAERLSWLTGFTGSAGFAVVLRDKAAVFVDGRYTLQVTQEVDTATFEVCHLPEQTLADWLTAHLQPGDQVGFDPWLHTRDDARKLARALRKVDASLKASPQNLLDTIWRSQPAAPLSLVSAQPLAFAGRASADKRAEVAALLRAEGVGAHVITAPDVLAWLLNIRGADVPYTPLCLGFGILRADASISLFTDPRKLTPSLRASFDDGVTIHPPEALPDALRALADLKRPIQVDAQTAAVHIHDTLSQAGVEVRAVPDPCMKLKAVKNAAEAEGTRAAHVRDGVAVTRFLRWLDQRLAQSTPLDEIEASDQLYALRVTGDRFRDLSFPSISGAGPNGAIVHYRASDTSKRVLEAGSLYLIDSGAQYQDGTTDITRTVAVGTPTAEMRERFTLVLKGHIALSTARFPAGTTGSQLDLLARQPLWERGLDYDHGTGHGVGSYLSVHEGPQRISKVANTQALLPGMILSNEPGYYKANAYGIRIENLVMVSAPQDVGGERPMLSFETLTLAPIDLSLVEPSLLSAPEIAWLNAYHARVREALAPLLSADEAAWLTAKTAAI
jgi:Xaa-Pro aminopeptidase